MTSRAPLLEVRGLRAAFATARGWHDAVRGLDLEISDGEVLALVGESGSGKSSAALALMRLLPQSASVSGSVRFEGGELLGMTPAAMRALRGNAISMIFQEPMSSLNPVHRVGEQIIEVLRAHQSLSVRAARLRALELLDRVQIAEPALRIDDYPHQLSGGQRQRVMIAMAIACGPRLLIADEPTTALDVTVQAQILALLDGLRRELRMSLLFITHDLGVVAQFADRVAVMFEGVKVEEAGTQELFERPSHRHTRSLLGASLQLVEGGRARKRSTVGPVLLRAEGLVVGYPRSRSSRTNAVDGVSFTIGFGETLGLIGESGCGKSTLARALIRLLPLRSGRLILDGEEVGALPERALRGFRRRVQMVFQDPYGSLNPRQTVGEILDVVLRVHGERDRSARRQRTSRMLERVGLPTDSGRRHPNEFSGGQRQRIAIARALLLKPALLVLDEPVSALDVSIQAQILDLLVELKSEFALSYLFISHDLAVVRHVSDRVVVMREGRLVETGTDPSIWDAPAHPYTRSLIEAAPRIPWRSVDSGLSAGAGS